VVQAALNTGTQGYVLETDAGSEFLNPGAGVLGGKSKKATEDM
jgi:hypothetical protein